MLERNTMPILFYQHFLNDFSSSVLLCIFSALVPFSNIIQTSTQLWPLAALLARPTFSGLWSQNYLKDGHVL